MIIEKQRLPAPPRGSQEAGLSSLLSSRCVDHQPHSNEADPRNLARYGEAPRQLTNQAVSDRGSCWGWWDDPLGDEHVSHRVDNTRPRQQKSSHAQVRLDLSPVAGLPRSDLCTEAPLALGCCRCVDLEEAGMQQDVCGFMGERRAPSTNWRPTGPWPLSGGGERSVDGNADGPRERRISQHGGLEWCSVVDRCAQMDLQQVLDVNHAAIFAGP